MAVETTLHKDQIFQLLRDHVYEIRAFGVSKLGLFGSAIRGDDTGKSDIDFLVEFKKGKKNYDNFIHLAYFLEDILQREVDLVTKKSLSERIKQNISNEIEYVSFNS